MTKKKQTGDVLSLHDIKNAALWLELQDERRHMVNYLDMKTRCEDWHAVADAAMDLREIDAKLSVLKSSIVVSK